MQNAGLQYGQGGAPVQESPFGVTSLPNSAPSSTSTLRQFRKKDVDKSAGGSGVLQPANAVGDPANSSHVARVAPHNHYPHKQNDYFRYPAIYDEYSSVKYSEIAEPVPQPVPHLENLPPSVLSKHPKEKDYVEMCNIPQQSHFNKPYQEHQFNGQQGYPQDMGLHHQYVQKEPQTPQIHSGYKPESQYLPKDAGFNHQIPPFLKYNIPQGRGYGMDNAGLAPFQRMDPHITRSIMSEHSHMREYPAEYGPVEQGRIYPQKQRYYSTGLPPANTSYPSNYAHRNIPSQQYNYPSCNYPRTQMNTSMGRYAMNMERSMSPRRTYGDNIDMGMGFPHQKMSNYPNYPAYAQHYQHRRPPPAVPQEYYHHQQHPHTRPHPQFMAPHHSQEVPENHVASNNIRQYLENWAEEEVTAEIPAALDNHKYISRINRDEANEVYVINASDLPQYLENGVPLVTTENGQYIFKSNVSIDNTGAIKILEKPAEVPPETQERVVSLHIVENPKSDCLVNPRQPNVNQEHVMATENIPSNTYNAQFNQSRPGLTQSFENVPANSSSPKQPPEPSEKAPMKLPGGEEKNRLALPYQVPQNSCIVMPSSQNRLNFDESLLPNPVPCSGSKEEELLTEGGHEELDKIVEDTLTSSIINIPMDNCEKPSLDKIEDGENPKIPDDLNLDLETNPKGADEGDFGGNDDIIDLSISRRGSNNENLDQTLSSIMDLPGGIGEVAANALEGAPKESPIKDMPIIDENFESQAAKAQEPEAASEPSKEPDEESTKEEAKNEDLPESLLDNVEKKLSEIVGEPCEEVLKKIEEAPQVPDKPDETEEKEPSVKFEKKKEGVRKRRIFSVDDIIYRIGADSVQNRRKSVHEETDAKSIEEDPVDKLEKEEGGRVLDEPVCSEDLGTTKSMEMVESDSEESPVVSMDRTEDFKVAVQKKNEEKESEKLEDVEMVEKLSQEVADDPMEETVDTAEEESFRSSVIQMVDDGSVEGKRDGEIEEEIHKTSEEKNEEIIMATSEEAGEEKNEQSDVDKEKIVEEDSTVSSKIAEEEETSQGVLDNCELVKEDEGVLREEIPSDSPKQPTKDEETSQTDADNNKTLAGEEKPAVSSKKIAKEEKTFEQLFVEPFCKEPVPKLAEVEEKLPPEDIQYRSVLKIEENNVVLEIAGELVEISVNDVNGKKVITVIPISNSATVDFNDNYEDLPKEDENQNITSTKIEESCEVFEDLILNENEIIIGDESLEEEINLDLQNNEDVSVEGVKEKPVLCTKAAKKLYDDFPLKNTTKTFSSLREFRRIKTKPQVKAAMEKVGKEELGERKSSKRSVRISTRHRMMAEQKEEPQNALRELIKRRKMRKEKIRLKYSQYAQNPPVLDGPTACQNEEGEPKKTSQVMCSAVKKVSNTNNNNEKTKREEYRKKVHREKDLIKEKMRRKTLEDKAVLTEEKKKTEPTIPSAISQSNFHEPRPLKCAELPKSSGAYAKYPKVSQVRDLSLTKNVNEHYLSRKDHSNLKKKLSIQEYNSRKRKLESKLTVPEKRVVPEDVVGKAQERPGTIYSEQHFFQGNGTKDPRRRQNFCGQPAGLVRSRSEDSNTPQTSNISSSRLYKLGDLSGDLMLQTPPPSFQDSYDKQIQDYKHYKTLLLEKASVERYASKPAKLSSRRKTIETMHERKYDLGDQIVKKKVCFDDNVQINEIHTTQSKEIKRKPEINYCEVSSSCSELVDEKSTVARLKDEARLESDWENSNSPKDSITDAFADSFLEKTKLKMSSNTNKFIIDINDFDTSNIDNELRSCSNSSSREGLKTFKQEVDSKLDSLNINIPKPAKARVTEDDVLMHKFLRKEQLNSEEIKQIRRIIYLKKKIQQLTQHNEVTVEDPPQDLKLQLKKVDLKTKKKKRRFRNLYSDSPETSESEALETAGEFSVCEGEDISGVKLIFKRKTDFLNLQPVVRLQRCSHIESMAKKIKIE